MNELALFAGAGGGLLGSRLLGWRTVCAVERDPYRQAVLLARQADGSLDPFPIWDDVRTFDGRPLRGLVDVVSAGFPCQPFSVAGKRRGDADERNGWPDTIRIIRDVRPRFAFLENVPGLLAHKYFGTVLGDLAEAGFDAEWCVLGADDVGAPHRRKRVWILAYAGRAGYEFDGGSAEACRASGAFEGEAQQRERSWDAAGNGGADVPDALRFVCESGAGRRGVRQNDPELADAERAEARPGDAREQGEPGLGRRGFADRRSLPDAAGPRCEGCKPAILQGQYHGLPAECGRWWARDPADEDPAAESFLGRVADGVADRVDQLAALGDGQVPAVVAAAWRELLWRIASV